MNQAGTITGNIVDIDRRQIYPARIQWKRGKIARIDRIEKPENEVFILPGFVDSHIHIESSMVTPAEFARMAVRWGTVATVSDPHEIANVCGLQGVRFMIGNGKSVPFHFFFGAPSCVPATELETSGAHLGVKEVREMLDWEDIHFLSEMMNFPGVLRRDEEVIQKIQAAMLRKKPVDGHAPGLRGEEMRSYFEVGITTDHECFTLEEAEEKAAEGVNILIREGSAAKNFDALWPLIDKYPAQVMFCSDDKHPDDLLKGHIDALVRRAIAHGCDLWNVLEAACSNPVRHYHLNVGQLRRDDSADFIVVKDLKDFEVLETWVEGRMVYGQEKHWIRTGPVPLLNRFHERMVYPSELKFALNEQAIPFMIALDKQLITEKGYSKNYTTPNLECDHEAGLHKIVVVNRYKNTDPAVGFIQNFGLKKGAIASSVAHDSHNIVAVGCSDEEICKAINAIMKTQGGVAYADAKVTEVLPLPIAGLMTTLPVEKVAAQYSKLDQLAKEAGCTLTSPFMTLSFMCLLVIPSVKISDKGMMEL